MAKALGGQQGTYNGEQYIIVNALGHLFELKQPSEQVAAALQAKYKSWSPDQLPWNEADFTWKRERKKDAAQFLKVIKTAAAKCSEIAICGDVDPSGEGFLIQAEIIQELGLRPAKLTRMYFDDESVVSFQKAFKTRKPVSVLEQNAEFVMAWYRSRWDFMSMQWTRIATAYGDGRSVLRQGRLKSAMVLLVGDQLAKVAAYKKVPFYSNKFRDENDVVYTNPDEPIFPDKNQVPNQYKSSRVVCDSKTKKSSAPPKFLDLAGVSAKLAAKGYKAKDVLAAAQKLYENQILSYPRTEDHVVSPEQFNDMLPNVDKIARVIGVDPKILTHRTPRSTHVKTGCAHGANRPGPVVPSSLDSLQAYGACAPLLYEMLARRYLASLAEDYEYEAQKGHVADYPKFVGTASVPLKPGWKAVTGSADFSGDDDNTKGLGTKADPFIHEGFPPKPAAPTMDWLIGEHGQLAKYNVGTGATRVSTYAEVTNERAKYPLLTDKKGKITMTEYGDMSYRLLPGTHIGDLKMTERVQQQMKDIADGKVRPDVCLHEIQQMICDDLKTIAANGQNMRKELGKTMSNFPDKEYCEGTWNGQQVKFNRVFCGHRFTDDECRRLLAGDEIEVTGLKSKSGNTYGVTGALANLEYNGHKYVGFERHGFAGSDSVPSTWSGHKFTDDEKTLLEMGKAVQLDDCISKKTGKPFKCKVIWGEENGRKKIIPDFT